MKKSNEQQFHLIDLIVISIGIIMLLLIGYIPYSTVSTLLEAIGTSLIAAGIVDNLIRRFLSEKQVENIEVVSDKRLSLNKEYEKRKLSAKSVDILGLNLAAALDEMANDNEEKFLKKIVFNGTKVRLLLLTPYAALVKQRSLEKGISLTQARDEQIEPLINCQKLFERIEILYKTSSERGSLERSRLGSLEIRLINNCPHFTIYRTDDQILWGIYTTERGNDAAVLSIPKSQAVIFDQLTGHFEKLWNGFGKDYILGRFYGRDINFNTDLYVRLLEEKNDD